MGKRVPLGVSVNDRRPRAEQARAEGPAHLFLCVFLWVLCVELCFAIGLRHVPRPTSLSADDFGREWVSVLLLERPPPAPGVEPQNVVVHLERVGSAPTPRARPWRSPFPEPTPTPGYLGASRIERELAGVIDEALAPLLSGQPTRLAVDPLIASLAPTRSSWPRPGTRPGPRGAAQPTPTELGPLVTAGPGRVAIGAKLDPTLALSETLISRVFPELTDTQVAALIRANFGAVNACFGRALRYRSDLGGKIVVAAEVSVGGRVREAAVVEDQLGESEVAICLATEVRRWQFPTARGTYAVRLPFILAHRGG